MWCYAMPMKITKSELCFGEQSEGETYTSVFVKPGVGVHKKTPLLIHEKSCYLDHNQQQVLILGVE